MVKLLSSIIALLSRFFGLLRRNPSCPLPLNRPVTIDIDNLHLRGEVDSRYLSFSIDISVLVGGFWWEGSMDVRRGLGALRIPPLNLDAPKLENLVRSLGPAYLRIGGSEADKIHYFEAPLGEKDPLLLTREQWDRLHDFLRRCDLKLMFTCKYGLFKRHEHGRWQGDELIALLEYSRAQGYDIDVFELGNELNAYWAFHGLRSQPRAVNLARDYDRFSALVHSYFPKARICGPGSAFWPRLGETLRPISNITPKFLSSLKTRLDIVDWHYYPFQSERSPVRTRSAHLHHLLAPKSFEDYRKFCQQLNRLRAKYQPQAVLWTGETGSAQCGGQPDLSDRWASSFWWADQLGQGAVSGQKVVVRQSLIGGDYGMIARLTLKPRPDFWVSWLWSQVMGTKVYGAVSDHPSIRAYLHSGRSGGFVLLLINLNDEIVPINLRCLIPSHLLRGYEMSAKKLTSRRVRINGEKARFKGGKVTLDSFPEKVFDGVIPPYSIGFWRLEQQKLLPVPSGE